MSQYRRRLAILVTMGVLGTLIAGCTSEPDAAPPTDSSGEPSSTDGGSPGPDGVPGQPGTPPPSGSSEQSITFDGYERTYRLYRPEGLAETEPVPLVVMLHGLLGSGKQAESWYGWNAVADREGFVVAYPDSRNRAWAVTEDCCGASARDGVDDVGFVAALVESLGQRLSLDPDRLYLAGVSNGGMLAYRLACDTAIFAAVTAVATTMLGDCPAPEPISLLHVHGTADETIPYGGGPGRRDGASRGRLPDKTDGPAVPDLVQRWQRIDECAAARTTVDGTVTTSAADCPAGRAVTLITIDGAGHQWPGSEMGPAGRLLGLDAPATELDATTTSWRFFTAHPKLS
ncbi:alpha/beta fold hydrolase [Solwaraspora sp. WMMB335]|uniref:alpha/beta hydrolase family esterase n=1 Tax=Solwaraspora sp. WMMB335 TaxID=3404118 RepID=UPI003B93824A